MDSITNTSVKLISHTNIENITDLDPQVGEIFVDNETQEVFVWTDTGLTKAVPNSNISMGLYELNKSIIKQIGTLDDLYDKMDLINEFQKSADNTFYMLYGKEISYFTVFHVNSIVKETLGSAVIDCLESVGDIYSIEYTEDKSAIEIWVGQDDDEVTCMYLFPYDSGIVDIGME